MSIRLITVDVDPEEEVMLRFGWTSPKHADTSDCIVSFFLLPPYPEAHVRYDLKALTCTI